MAEITVMASLDNLNTVIQFVKDHLKLENCSTKILRQVIVAVEEIFVNIAHYAYNPEEGSATVRCEVGGTPLQVRIGFLDCGKPYNPLEKTDPNTSLSARERSIGGLGIFMTKQLMDEVQYDFCDGKNILTLSKNILP